MVFNRGSSSSLDCATIERGSAALGVRGFASPIPCSHLVHGPPVAVVLQGEIYSPDFRILGLVGQLDDTKERIPGFLLALEDIHEQCGDRAGSHRRGDGSVENQSSRASLPS
jgi:hypothetical protein